jgi:NAD+ synthase
VGGIVVGTGNKVEDFGVGFFTKYGDGGVDISPIADLTKTEVRNLAKELGVIEDIILAKPTDGLWDDDRTDEEQIGASYEELEWAMAYEGDIIELKGRQREVHDIFTGFNTRNKHKMVAIPMFINNDS